MITINVVYSGGTLNTDQESSLGGFPSPTPITTNKNNLFNDVSPQQISQGIVDYRCLYVFNDDTNIKYGITLYIEYLQELGATVHLGFILRNAIQNLNFTQVPTSGTFKLMIQNLESDVITWDNNPNTLADNIKSALKPITDCSISVIANRPNFNITFSGSLGNKALTLMTLVENNLSPGIIIPTVSQVVSGSPINTVAPEISSGASTPTGIPFGSVLKPGISIGTLYPAEGFPVWIKRILGSGAPAVVGDGFILHSDLIGVRLN